MHNFFDVVERLSTNSKGAHTIGEEQVEYFKKFCGVKRSAKIFHHWYYLYSVINLLNTPARYAQGKEHILQTNPTLRDRNIHLHILTCIRTYAYSHVCSLCVVDNLISTEFNIDLDICRGLQTPAEDAEKHDVMDEDATGNDNDDEDQDTTTKKSKKRKQSVVQLKG